MWAPQLGPQTDAITATWCPELFFGGAAGGGKSDLLLGDYLQDVPTYDSAWRGVLFRRTYPELEELQARAREIYPSTGAKWNENKRIWTWSNGANLKMRYAESDADATRYQGHQYAWIGWDEKTQWRSLYLYRYLRARLRSAGRPVPTARIRSAGNPGGPGHLEVKAYFIDPARFGYTPILDPDTGMERMFIPSKLEDNTALMTNDPGYRGRLKGLGGNLAKAMLDGDWDIIEGAFFDNWSAGRNVIRPFEIPADWTRFRSLDWGSARPFAVQWWAVASDAVQAQTAHGPINVPRGALILYRQWYGSSGKPNEGLKLPAERVAAGFTGPDGAHVPGIKDREKGEVIAYGVADPAIFSSDGGPSIGERMFTAGVRWKAADNARVSRKGAMGGWDQMRLRISGDDDGPGLVVFSTCTDFLRTVPVLQHDADRAEDIDTEGEDHDGDAARYACMSRPYVARPAAPPKPPIRGVNQMTFAEALQVNDRRRRDGWVA